MIRDVHTSHCCVYHGCKYGDEHCTVEKGLAPQEGPCEQCGLELEGHYGEYCKSQAIVRWPRDFRSRAVEPSRRVKVFNYISKLDCFVVRPEFKWLMDRLGLCEWTPVVWLGRLFLMDNDYGEHWFDNWDQREKLAEQSKELSLEEEELMIVVPERFVDGKDGPCHSDEQRKRFWTDVLCSLTLHLDTVFNEARSNGDISHEEIEKRIVMIEKEYRYDD